MLEGFQIEDPDAVTLGILHADPTQRHSPYCPVTRQQVGASGLDYLALGHIHKGGAFREGKTLCLWPGCPMGRGFDEQGEKGVQIVTIVNHQVAHRFIPLDTPRFYDWTANAADDPVAAISSLLPPVGNQNFYRITLTGECDPPNPQILCRHFPQFPNLTIEDCTLPPLDLWEHAGEDSLEGVYFGLLQEQLKNADAAAREKILLAARISRQILENREVTLP
jgi:DNA repair exonuclease SbcCD nuclease subunit